MLSPASPLATWDEQGRVLLLSWHCHPERYIENEAITLLNGAVWTFTDKEIAAWYEENGTEYGLTEFLINENATVEVAFTKTTEEFLAWLSNGVQTLE